MDDMDGKKRITYDVCFAVNVSLPQSAGSEVMRTVPGMVEGCRRVLHRNRLCRFGGLKRIET